MNAETNSGKGLAIGGLCAAVMLVGGCTPTSPQQLTTAVPSPVTTSSGPTSPPPVPVKYALNSIKSCVELQSKIQGLPPAQEIERTKVSETQVYTTCPFKDSGTDGPLAVLQLDVWDHMENITGFHAGPKRAKEKFVLDSPSSEDKDSLVGIGDEARWKKPEPGGGCSLEILDGNAVLRAFYRSRRNEDPRSEQCRGPVRDLAKKLYAAVQPK